MPVALLHIARWLVWQLRADGDLGGVAHDAPARITVISGGRSR